VIDSCSEFKITDEGNELVEHGKQMKQGQRNDLPIVEKHEFECEEVFKKMCLMMGVRDLLKVVNVLFGIELKAYEYALYIFKALDASKFYFALIDLLLKRINTITNALQSDNIDDLKLFIIYLQEKPQLLYRPLYPKNKLSEMIDNLNADEMQKITSKIYPEQVINRPRQEARTINNNDLKKNDKLNKLIIYIILCKKLKPNALTTTGEIVRFFEEYKVQEETETYAEKMGAYCYSGDEPQRFYQQQLSFLLYVESANTRPLNTDGSPNIIRIDGENRCMWDALQFQIAQELMENKQRAYILSLISDYLNPIEFQANKGRRFNDGMPKTKCKFWV
jgi:hypothetical protein